MNKHDNIKHENSVGLSSQHQSMNVLIISCLDIPLQDLVERIPIAGPRRSLGYDLRQYFVCAPVGRGGGGGRG